MKNAKFILTSLAILAIIGGVLAFKASRFSPSAQLWTLLPGNKTITTTTASAPGIIFSTTVPNCVRTGYYTTDVGPLVVTRTTSTSAAVTTVFVSGPLQFVTTYPFCTLITTPITNVD